MVHFVGAGCGAKDLITVRGKSMIESADVIVYAGSLVNPELLDYARKDCEIHNSAEMTLDEVIEVMVRAEKEHKTTIRLHTGDPSIFGAVREQADMLASLGIDFDICPGVSSFCGASAVLKAEYTLPDVSQTIILTRMAGRTPVPESESIESLASHRSSMVIFLSTGMLGELSERLIKGGYSPDTPSAIVYKATWSDQKILRCKVSELEETARKNGVKKTALVTVGDFLGDSYSLSKLYDPEFETEFRKAENNTH